MGVNKSSLGVTDPAKVDARAQELLDEADNATPPNWSPDQKLTGSDGFIQNSSNEYVVAHSAEDWQLSGRSFIGTTQRNVDADLGSPKLQFDADEPVVLSVWDPEREALVEDTIDADLPGRTVPENRTIVIEQVGPGGDVLSDPIKRDTKPKVRITDVGNLGSKTHHAVTLDLSEGFYRVYPEGSPERSILIAKGNPEEMISTWETDLQNRADQLSAKSDRLRNLIEDEQKLQTWTTTTNATGHWNQSIPSDYTLVAVTAYKGPYQSMSADPQNVTMEDIRTFYETTEFNGSMALATRPKRVSPPADNVNIVVVETRAPPHLNSSRYLDIGEELLRYLANMSYSELPTALQEQLDGVSRERLEELSREVARLSNNNEALRDRVLELSDRDNIEVEVNDTSTQELIKLIRAQQQAMQELRSSIESDTTTRLKDGAVTSTATFARELSSEEVTVLAKFPNGTTRVVDEQYLSFTTSPNLGTETTETAVTVEDFPLGESDPGSVQFVYQVASADGVGKETTTVSNPTKQGSVPELRAISLSSLNPGPDEAVSMTILGGEDTQVTNISDVQVFAPDGTELTATVDGAREVDFTTAGEGSHFVKLTFETASGQTGTLTHRIAAGDVGRDIQPGVRIKETPFGTVAVTGDGIEAGSVEVENGGSRVVVNAQIGQGEDVPTTLHIYTAGMSLPPDTTLTTRVVQGESQQSVSKNVEVVVHTASMTNANRVIYANSDPLPREGSNPAGQVTTSADGTTIIALTDASGVLDIEMNNNPGILDRISYRVASFTGGIDVPFLFLLPGGGLGVAVPLLVRRRRTSA